MAEAFVDGPHFDFEFSDVPFQIGVDKASGKPLRIGLVCGTCEIAASGDAKHSFTWDILSVTLSGPILGDPDVEIKWVRDCQVGHEMWKWTTSSIIAACSEDIDDRAREVLE